MEGPVASTELHPTSGEAGNWARKGAPAPGPAPARILGLRPRQWKTLGHLAILLLLTAGLRGWLVFNTSVAARDSIGYIRYALQLEQLPLGRVLRDSQQHPGYPALLLFVSQPIRWYLGGITPVSMQLSAQLASSLASILLVVPMYFLGRELFDRRVGFWSALLFQCLPVGSRVMADGLSEATFLLFTTSALILALRALRLRSPVRLILSGMAGGLAYLTRPEGALVTVATGLVLVGLQIYPLWRRPWWEVVRNLTLVSLAALAVGGPYAYIIGNFTNKPTPRHVIDDTLGQAPASGGSEDRPQSCVQEPRPAGGRILTAALFGIYAPSDLEHRYVWGLWAIATEVAKAYQYLFCLPVILGAWWFRQRLRVVPGAWIVLVLAGLHTLVLWRLAVVVGYVSERHVLLPVLCGIFPGIAILLLIIDALVAMRWRQRFTLGHTPAPSRPGWRTGLATAALGTWCALGVGETLRPLHINRAGHRAAGEWLAEHANVADPLTDPFCWAHYYSGRVFWEGRTPPVPEGHPLTHYVVLEQSDHEHIRLPRIAESQALARQGRLVYHWPPERAPEDAKVFVFAVPIPR